MRTESLNGSEGSLSYNKLLVEKMGSGEEEEEEDENSVVFFFMFGTINDKLVSAIEA